MSQDLKGLIISLIYVVAVVAVSEFFRRSTGRKPEFTRKFVHIFVGLWIIPTLTLFTKWHFAALLPACAIVANFASMKMKLIASIERDAKYDYGTVLFPVSFVLVIALFFHSSHPEAAAAGIVVMALGDAAAALIGVPFGRHRYTLLGAKKSLEGSAAMFVVSAVAVFSVLLYFEASPSAAMIVALALATVGTALEAAGKYGLDNFTVPVACSALAYLVLSLLEASPA